MTTAIARDENWKSTLLEQWGSAVRFDEPMARHTSFRIGGPAEALLPVDTLDDLCEAVQWARRRRIEYCVIGQGTNLLVADEGTPGLVILNQCSAYTLNPSGTPPGRGADSDQVTVFAESGVPLGVMARRLSASGWSGLEWAVAIPGTVGGAVVGNAGAFGRDMSDSVTKVSVLEPDGQRREAPAEELRFGYRSSCFKEESGQRRRRVVLGAELTLKKGQPEEITRFAEEVVQARKRTQPLRYPSAGSVFKNPPLDRAGRLIQAAGLKGARIGDAQVSLKHANFIVNCGEAKASDVVQLISLIRSEVKEQFQQELDLEIVYVGPRDQAVQPERMAGHNELKAGTRCCSSMRSVL